MNLGNLQTDLYSRLGWGTTPDSSTVSRLLRFLNETHREILGKGAIGPKLRRTTLTFTTVASSPFAVLPQSAVSVSAISDRTNKYTLDQYSLNDIRFNDPGLSSSVAAPYGFVDLNYAAPVARDPSDASQIFVVGTAADVRTAYLEGVRSNGQYISLSKVLTGAVAVSMSATFTDIVAITKFYMSAASATSIAILTEDSAVGTELGRIAENRTYARYTRFHIYPTPSSAITLYADVELHVEDMATSTDESLLPEDFHWLLTSGTLIKEYMKRMRADLAALEQPRFAKGVQDLMLFLNRRQGPIQSGSRQRQFSMLGPFFPAGS